MIQGGGFTADMNQKTTRPPIVNEARNGLKNKRGAIAMARLNDPNSATAQFFINHVDNAYLDKSGYAVFGQVVEGMDVVDSIAKVKTGIKDMHEGVPVEPVIIKSAKIVSKKE
jgi:cyclophilin family peptidyl-prolyl cis-trans isomerase